MKKSEEFKIENILYRLSKSKFRSSFKLADKDRVYIREKGINTIRSHAYDFIKKRLASRNLIDDGHQTPMRGHPVFIAQHATATCCRSCLYKWHKIDKNHDLTNIEIDYIVSLIMMWIERENR